MGGSASGTPCTRGKGTQWSLQPGPYLGGPGVHPQLLGQRQEGGQLPVVQEQVDRHPATCGRLHQVQKQVWVGEYVHDDGHQLGVGRGAVGRAWVLGDTQRWGPGVHAVGTEGLTAWPLWGVCTEPACEGEKGGPPTAEKLPWVTSTTVHGTPRAGTLHGGPAPGVGGLDASAVRCGKLHTWESRGALDSGQRAGGQMGGPGC